MEQSSLNRFREAKEELALWLNSLADQPISSEIKTGAADDALTVQGLSLGLSRQVRADTFKVAVLGEYSSGKSSLLNVLLRLHAPDGRRTDGLLPTAVAPTTAVITTLVYDEARGVEITLDDGRKLSVSAEQLNGFLTESTLRRKKFWWSSNAEENERIAEHITQVRIGCVSPLLQEGVELVDSPGIGSLNEKHGRITKQFTAEIDAALFLVSVDPPMGEREMTFLQHIKTVTDRCLFVQTKRDLGERTEHGEVVWQRREREHRRRIEEVLNRRDYPFFSVSAYQAAHGLRRHDDQEFADSGFAALEIELQHFLVAERGIPRFEAWLKRSKSWLPLLETDLHIKQQQLQARLAETTIALARQEDYEQEKKIRNGLEQALDQNLRAANEQLANKNKEYIEEVMREARRELSLISGEQLAKNPDRRYQIERTLTRSIQYHSSDMLTPVIDFYINRAQTALQQALGEDMPKTLQQFLNADFNWEASQLDVELNGLVETRTYTRNEKRGGLGFIDAILGPRQVEVTEHNLDKDRFIVTVEKAAEEVYREIKSEMQSTLKAMDKAVKSEMGRIVRAAKSAADQQVKIQQQDISECYEQAEQNRQQTAQLKEHTVKLNQIEEMLEGLK